MNKKTKTLQEIMNLNENFHKECQAAPNCRFDEGQALQKHFIDCVRQWLTQDFIFFSEPNHSVGILAYLDRKIKELQK